MSLVLFLETLHLTLFQYIATVVTQVLWNNIKYPNQFRSDYTATVTNTCKWVWWLATSNVWLLVFMSLYKQTWIFVFTCWLSTKILDFWFILKHFRGYKSSIVNEIIRTISSLFIIFFLRKNFKLKKMQIKQKPTNKTKTGKQKTTKVMVFHAKKNL